MKKEISIRDYTAVDKDAVLDLLRLNTPKYFAFEEEQDFVDYLENEIEYYYVLELNSKIVGCGGFNFSGDYSTGKISWDIFHPDYQGQSLGTKLLNFRIQKLKEFEVVKKITVRTSQLVYRFYEKSGFKLLEVVKDYWAPGFDLYKLEYT